MSGNARSDEIDTKFRQTARMIMDLTILANFSQIAQSEINSVEVKILALELFASHGFYSFAEDCANYLRVGEFEDFGEFEEIA